MLTQSRKRLLWYTTLFRIQTKNLSAKTVLLSYLQKEKEITNQLASRLMELESQLVRGGRNILDTYTERQAELQKKLDEIAERKVI